MKQMYIKILALSVLIAGLSLTSSIAQVNDANLPLAIKHGHTFSSIDTYFQPNTFGDFDYAKSGEEDGPLRVGYSFDVEIGVKSHGTLVNWKNGEESWLFRIETENAPAVALIFRDVNLPPDARLFVYSESDPTSFYCITYDNVAAGFASTPPLTSGPIIVEYVEAVLSRGKSLRGSFNISNIYFIYRGISDLTGEKGLGGSEACHININCSPEGDAWQNQKRGVAKMLFTEGTSLYACSGTLVNNTNQDSKPYFLTAYHCGGNLTNSDRSTWQFYFNYERPGCENISAPPNNLITGATLAAKGLLEGGSDFQLIKLTQSPLAAWRPYFNGWDRAESVVGGGVSIHHPMGDAKKISTYTAPLTSANPTIDGLQMAANSTWRVTWAETANGQGVTEGGSSGSPIFNSSGLVVGSLSGGSSSCSSLNSPDYYGKFNYHWESNGTTAESKLQPWLDPSGSNVSMLLGFDPSGDLYANFKADKTTAQTGEQIIFNDLSTGTNITSWSWSFGVGANPTTANSQGPHTVTYSTGGVKTVSLIINGTETNTKTDYIRIQEIPSNTILFESFEGNTFPPTGWQNVDQDGDTYKWFSYIADGAPYSGVKCAGSASWNEVDGKLTPDNWLITPPIEITHDNFMLRYYVAAQDPEWPQEKYGVFISRTGDSLSDFTEVFVETMQDGAWKEREINLSEYLGDIIYIAFRHFDSSDKFYIKLDDVLILGGGDLPSDQARIHTFGFQEQEVLSVEIEALENNQAAISVQVRDIVDITSLIPKISISGGAKINYTHGTAIDFTEPVSFTVTSESEQVVNDYTVTVTYAQKYPVVFKVVSSSQEPIGEGSIQISSIEQPIITNSEGIASTNLYVGDYTYSLSAADYNTYTGSFNLTASGAEVNVTMVHTGDQMVSVGDPVIFPNPFGNSITLRNIESFQRVYMVNVLGEVLYNAYNNGLAEMLIDTSKLPQGVYFVVTESYRDGRRVIRSIKQ